MSELKCLHGNGPECTKCKALDIPEVEELEQELDALRARLATAEAERDAKVRYAELLVKEVEETRAELDDLRAAVEQSKQALMLVLLERDESRKRGQETHEFLDKVLDKAEITLPRVSVGPGFWPLMAVRLLAERDAARAEVKSMRQEREDALTASGMNWQAYLDLSATSTVKQTQLSGEIGLGEQRIKELEEALLTAQSGEARAVECLRKVVKELFAFDVLCEGEMFGENKDLREIVEEADSIVKDAQPALAWLAQREADLLKGLYDEWLADESDQGSALDDFRRFILRKANRLQAGATGGSDDKN